MPPPAPAPGSSARPATERGQRVARAARRPRGSARRTARGTAPAAFVVPSRPSNGTSSSVASTSSVEPTSVCTGARSTDARVSRPREPSRRASSGSLTAPRPASSPAPPSLRRDSARQQTPTTTRSAPDADRRGDQLHRLRSCVAASGSPPASAPTADGLRRPRRTRCSRRQHGTRRRRCRTRPTRRRRRAHHRAPDGARRRTRRHRPRPARAPGRRPEPAGPTPRRSPRPPRPPGRLPRTSRAR